VEVATFLLSRSQKEFPFFLVVPSAQDLSRLSHYLELDPSMMSMEMEHVAFQECCLPWAAVLTHSKPTGMPDSV